MLEQLGLDSLDPRSASVLLGILIGLAFGALAEVTRFCLRRAIVVDAPDRRSAQGVWAIAFAVAIAGMQIATGLGLVDLSEHRFLAPDLPVLAIVVGGLLFGAGMVLTRGCASRLTVLAGTGNLRALTVMIVFAIAAHATLKGVLAPVRTALGSIILPVGEAASLGAVPGGPIVATAVLSLFGIWLALRSGAAPRMLFLAALLGALVPLGWLGTGLVLQDEFDPIAVESLSFTLPAAESLFWVIASSAVPAGFGTGLFGGVLVGAALLSLIGGRFRWQGFSTPREMGRYLTGGTLMGVGGVLAGGCTVGAGLSGASTLSVAALLALGAIILGARLADRAFDASAAGSAAQAATRPA
ncbi:sulfur transporter [Albidovulum inexpectatum]|uniref:Sulfur transporter n=1 Tax=Albidovulum inexpectatum TaxID=196587 RepID=A0A2S5JK37_9RHOB|nr:YeeE/YedE family protein [Albidovulum inexpectatum]PPB81864.1 sulfur transporter [Albidovulum inexpectatum]